MVLRLKGKPVLSAWEKCTPIVRRYAGSFQLECFAIVEIVAMKMRLKMISTFFTVMMAIEKRKLNLRQVSLRQWA